MARALIERGFKNVRPLAGGFDAWVAAGFPIEDFSDEKTEMVSSG
ncbi:MAG: hypothetical protein ABJC61_15205 [Acidobacteriota bacterium]